MSGEVFKTSSLHQRPLGKDIGLNGILMENVENYERWLRLKKRLNKLHNSPALPPPQIIFRSLKNQGGHTTTLQTSHKIRKMRYQGLSIRLFPAFFIHICWFLFFFPNRGGPDCSPIAYNPIDITLNRLD